jgi:hypothetical protein
VVAQKKKFVTVKAGNNIMDVLPTSEVFLYPQFTSARVFLRNNSAAEAKLNYSRLVDEMHFIDQKGDTLALDNETDVKYIVAGNDTFYYDEGYVRVVTTGSFAKLAIREVWVVARTRQLGAYNSTNNSVNMLSFKSLEEGGRLYDLVVNEDVILKKEEKYFFGDNFNQFVTATKANLLMLFPKEQQRIGTYLKENKINFYDKAHLEKTVQFVNEISQK